MVTPGRGGTTSLFAEEGSFLSLLCMYLYMYLWVLCIEMVCTVDICMCIRCVCICVFCMYVYMYVVHELNFLFLFIYCTRAPPTRSRKVRSASAGGTRKNAHGGRSSKSKR